VKRLIRFSLVAILGGLLIFVFVVFPAMRTHKPDKRMVTMGRIHQCYVHASAERQIRGEEEFTRQLESGRTPEERFERLAQMLNLPEPLKENLVDAWGRPMLLDIDPKTQNIVIWSAGPNGINENRSGDDVSIEDDTASGP
jgi:hypothetical protein